MIKRLLENNNESLQRIDQFLILVIQKENFQRKSLFDRTVEPRASLCLKMLEYQIDHEKRKGLFDAKFRKYFFDFLCFRTSYVIIQLALFYHPPRPLQIIQLTCRKQQTREGFGESLNLSFVPSINSGSVALKHSPLQGIAFKSLGFGNLRTQLAQAEKKSCFRV